jgi:2-oxoglutarate/2-oxoacid ferredoxin oxidoreductase subunit beta
VVEVIQNCVIFNDGAFDAFTSKETRDDNTLTLHHGEKMIFGKNRDKGIILKDLKLKVVKDRGRRHHREGYPYPRCT